MLSIKEETTHTIIIKKSEFVTHLIPCSNIEQASELISLASDPDATHNCVAYIIGSQERAFDDGEPSGTAGLPMLNVLKMQGLSNVIAVVTRYFGGIKLGAGGLTRAYSQCVAEALKEANIVETEKVKLYRISIDYHFMRKMEHLIKTSHIPCIHQAYEEKVIYDCYIKDESFFTLLQDLTSNLYEYECIREDYIEKK